MIPEEQQDQAALYALGLLEPREATEFEAAMTSNPELRQLANELQEAAATLALSSPTQVPPPALRQRLMRELAVEGKARWWQSQVSWVSWGIAAGLALLCGLLFLGRGKLAKTAADLEQRIAASEQRIATLTSERDRATETAAENRQRAEAAQLQLAQLNEERDALARKITQLEERDAASRVEAAKLTADRDALQQRIAELERKAPLTSIQVATLTSKMSAAPEAKVTIAWDGARQEGILKTSDVPPTGRDRDYQLWIVDPRYKDPVSAGVFSVTQGGRTEIVFRPKLRIASAKAFAVSLERKGGVSKAEGPIVFAGP